jgi:hypothetical protein
MQPHSDRDALIDALLTDLRRQLEAELPADTASLDQIEEAVARLGDRFRRQLQQRIVTQRSRTPRDNRTACPTCGFAARYRDTLPRVLTTRHGDVRLLRPYYHCPVCQKGFAPLDRALGLDAGATTTQVRLWAAHLGAQLSFLPATDTLELLTGVRLCATTLERTAVAIGAAWGQATRHQAKQHQAGQLPEATRKPKRLYIAIDGIMTPLRDPWKRDRSLGKLACRYGECKVGVVYEARPGETGDAGVRHRAYVATLGDVDEFTPLLGALAHEHGHHWAKEVIVLGDGAVWIWRLAAKQFPTAIQIVDFIHATEHLYAVARERFGAETKAAHEWVKARQGELKRDEVEAVVKAIEAWEVSGAGERELKERERGYFAGNAERMRYGTYEKQGYHIGSGVVEAGCKQVVGQRLDQAGMHWRQESAEAIVGLRAALLSTEAPDLRPYCAMAA